MLATNFLTATYKPEWPWTDMSKVYEIISQGVYNYDSIPEKKN